MPWNVKISRVTIFVISDLIVRLKNFISPDNAEVINRKRNQNSDNINFYIFYVKIYLNNFKHFRSISLSKNSNILKNQLKIIQIKI